MTSRATDTANDNGYGTPEPAGQSAFHGSSHAVYTNWDFVNTWLEHPDGLPTLRALIDTILVSRRQGPTQ